MSASEDDFPKVLIVARDSIDRFGSYGIWTSSLFGSWPRDKLAQLVYQSYPMPIDESLNTQVLTRRDIRVLGSIQAGRDRFVCWRGRHGTPEEREATMQCGHGMSSKPSAARRHRRWWRAWSDLFPLRMPSSVGDWVREFSPDVIYAPLSASRFMRLVMGVAKMENTPVFAYFHDDWPGARYRETPLTWGPRWYLLHNFRQIRQYIKGVGATSESMACEYRDRFGFENCSALMHCVEVPLSCPELLPVAEDRPIRFVYIGGLHLKRWKSLRDLGLVLQQLHSEGHEVEAVIHAPQNDVTAHSEALNIPPVMRVAGFLPPEKMPGVIDESDVVVHVESFSPAERRYTRLSLSTKIPTYMSRGRPILAYGPGEVASCRYIGDSKAGVVVPEESRELLVDGVRRLVTDTTLRTTAARNAWDTARRNHDIVEVRERFRKSIVAVAQRANDAMIPSGDKIACHAGLL